MASSPYLLLRLATARVLALLPTLAFTLVSATAAHASCTVSATALAFGTYQPLSFVGHLHSGDVSSAATVSVRCEGVSGYSLRLGPSVVENSIYPRYMGHSSGGNPMMFNVFTDATYQTVWGDGAVGGLIVNGPLNGTFVHVVYGRIPARQHTLKAGSYSGSLTITVSYDP